MNKIAMITGATSGIGKACAYCVNTPLRVNIDEMVILPKNQAGLELYRSGK